MLYTPDVARFWLSAQTIASADQLRACRDGPDYLRYLMRDTAEHLLRFFALKCVKVTEMPLVNAEVPASKHVAVRAYVLSEAEMDATIAGAYQAGQKSMMGNIPSLGYGR